MKTKFSDQNQLPVIRDQLLLHSRSLTAALESFTGKKISEPTLSKSTHPEKLFADIDLLESHVELLNREITSARQPQAVAVAASAQLRDNDEPGAPAPQVDSPAPAAVSPVPVIIVRPNPAGTISNRQWNPDGQLLAANGVKSYDELNKKVDLERGLGKRRHIGD